MSSPPAKRPRTEDAPTTRSEIWYSDGSVVLQAENTQFRVHWSVLALNSFFFRDLQGLPQPSNEPSVDGCPVVQLLDAVVDVEHLLRALYNPKYDFEILFNIAVERLAFENPTTLKESDALWDALKAAPGFQSYTTTKIVYYAGIWRDIVILARENLQTILPCAYFRVATLPITGVFKEIQRPDGTCSPLSPVYHRTCAVGRANIRQVQWEPGNTLGLAGPWEVPDDCMDPTKSSRATANLRNRLCTTCAELAVEKMTAGRTKMWEELPSFFGLPPWNGLKNYNELKSPRTLGVVIGFPEVCGESDLRSIAPPQLLRSGAGARAQSPFATWSIGRSERDHSFRRLARSAASRALAPRTTLSQPFGLFPHTRISIDALPYIPSHNVVSSPETQTPGRRVDNAFGCLILQAENTQFRVHWSFLAQNSSVFREMQGLPQPADQPSIEGCPIVELQDAVVDVEHLLKVLYHQTLLLQKALPFPVVAALIRLGRKYDFRILFDTAAERLAFENPTTLKEYDALLIAGTSNYKPTRIVYYPGIEFDMLTVARENNIMTALPCVYYRAARFRLLTNGNASSAANPSKAQGQPGYTFGWLSSWDNENCTDPLKCAKEHTRGLRLYHASLSVMALTAWTPPGHGLCVSCHQQRKELLVAGREKMWEELPGFFKLQPWNELANDNP
ncbi:hypothetical protein B0H19DRAFT_1056037 [Mycena capillaripes]|nr:hypothetical protein B0H19DRAFT_1056037 [Mycena capillaripes]